MGIGWVGPDSEAQEAPKGLRVFLLSLFHSGFGMGFPLPKNKLS